MRCRCCDKPLNEYEVLSKNPITGDFEDLCRGCINLVRQSEALPDFDPDSKDMDMWLEYKTLDKPSDPWYS